MAVVLAAFGLGLWQNATAVSGLDTNNCLSCHRDRNLFKIEPDGRRISLYVSEQLVNTAAHRFIDCTTCHGLEPHKMDSDLSKQSLAEKCGTCHKYEYELHRRSIHGQKLAAGNGDVATCVDCHSAEGNPHSVIRVLEFSAPTYKTNTAETCGKCHSSRDLMENYGIVETVYETYMRSFHGRAIELAGDQLAALNFATCTSCHGFHDIKAVDDPNSPVAGEDNLVQTCEQCHPGAGAEFAKSFLGHKEATPANVAPVYYVELGFTVFLLSVVGLGIVILIAGIVGIVSRRWRKQHGSHS